MSDSKCSTCRMPPPADHCWESRFDCPCGKLPRVLDTREAVHLLAWLLAEAQHRIKALENPPCCTGGPQWGHTYACPKCPD
jgi:hypothetical protein